MSKQKPSFGRPNGRPVGHRFESCKGLLKWTNLGFFLFFSRFTYKMKTVDFGRIRTRINRVECEYADHLIANPSIILFILVAVVVVEQTALH